MEVYRCWRCSRLLPFRSIRLVRYSARSGYSKSLPSCNAPLTSQQIMINATKLRQIREQAKDGYNRFPDSGVTAD